HKSIQGILAYKEVNEKQHLAAMDTLIHGLVFDPVVAQFNLSPYSFSGL
ncbi:19917_t:CDS:1, partial [Entrophospora sp. SA101]